MGDSMHIEITDNSGLAKEEMQAACLRALERCGLQAEGYAKNLCPVDTGNLRSSITHQVDSGGPAAYIGSGVEYAPHVELGTGKYYPGGRQAPWVYQDEKGSWHMTNGQRAQPYLKPAVAGHVQTYRDIIEDEMHG